LLLSINAILVGELKPSTNDSTARFGSLTDCAYALFGSYCMSGNIKQTIIEAAIKEFIAVLDRRSTSAYFSKLHNQFYLLNESINKICSITREEV
jgi:hypothetical protein